MVFHREITAEVEDVVAEVSDGFDPPSSAFPRATKSALEVLPVAAVPQEGDIVVKGHVLKLPREFAVPVLLRQCVRHTRPKEVGVRSGLADEGPEREFDLLEENEHIS